MVKSRKRAKRNQRKNIYIVCAWDTEVYYFKWMRNSFKSPNLRPPIKKPVFSYNFIHKIDSVLWEEDIMKKENLQKTKEQKEEIRLTAVKMVKKRLIKKDWSF